MKIKVIKIGPEAIKISLSPLEGFKPGDVVRYAEKGYLSGHKLQIKGWLWTEGWAGRTKEQLLLAYDEATKKHERLFTSEKLMLLQRPGLPFSFGDIVKLKCDTVIYKDYPVVKAGTKGVVVFIDPETEAAFCYFHSCNWHETWNYYADGLCSFTYWELPFRGYSWRFFGHGWAKKSKVEFVKKGNPVKEDYGFK